MRLRNHVRFHDHDPGRPFHGAKILSGSRYLVVTHGLRETNHEVSVGFSLVRALPGAVFEIVQRMYEVGIGEACYAGVFRTTLAIWIVAQRAGPHVWFVASRHD